MPANTIQIADGDMVFSNHSKWKIRKGWWDDRGFIHDTTAAGDGTDAYHIEGVRTRRMGFIVVVEPGDLALNAHTTTATLTLATGHTLSASFTINWRLAFTFSDGSLLLTGTGIANGAVTYTAPA